MRRIRILKDAALQNNFPTFLFINPSTNNPVNLYGQRKDSKYSAGHLNVLAAWHSWQKSKKSFCLVIYLVIILNIAISMLAGRKYAYNFTKKENNQDKYMPEC